MKVRIRRYIYRRCIAKGVLSDNQSILMLEKTCENKPGLKIHGKQLYSTFSLDSCFCSVGKKKACPLGSSRIATKIKEIILFMMRCEMFVGSCNGRRKSGDTYRWMIHRYFGNQNGDRVTASTKINSNSFQFTHTVRNLHFLSKNSTLISRENCQFCWDEKLVKMLLLWTTLISREKL